MRVSSLRLLAGVAGAIAIALAGTAAAGAAGYVVKPLVSNNGVTGTLTDTNLVNAWGLVSGPTTPWWVADNGANVSTLYTGLGARVNLVVNVGDAPTGIVFNNTSGFNLPTGGLARFLFDSEAGVISGWNGGANAQTFVDLSKTGAVFKGLAIAATSAGPRLFATDFAHSRIDVFDGAGHMVPQPFFAFSAPPGGKHRRGTRPGLRLRRRLRREHRRAGGQGRGQRGAQRAVGACSGTVELRPDVG
jgi:hypothetical protein